MLRDLKRFRKVWFGKMRHSETLREIKKDSERFREIRKIILKNSEISGNIQKDLENY